MMAALYLHLLDSGLSQSSARKFSAFKESSAVITVGDQEHSQFPNPQTTMARTSACTKDPDRHFESFPFPDASMPF